MASGPVAAWQIEGEEVEVVTDLLFFLLQNHCGRWLQPWNQKTIASWLESIEKPRQCIEKQRHCNAIKCLYSQGYGLPSGHLWLWELDCKEDSAKELMPLNCGAAENFWKSLVQQDQTSQS